MITRIQLVRGCQFFQHSLRSGPETFEITFAVLKSPETLKVRFKKTYVWPLLETLTFRLSLKAPNFKEINLFTGAAVFWVIGASFFVIGLHASFYNFDAIDDLSADDKQQLTGNIVEEV